MEILEGLVTSALIVAIQMGVPVAVLFIMGYLAYRDNRDPRARWGSGRADERPCWERKQCSPDVRAACPVGGHPGLACWQCIKASLGQLQPQCLECERFLAPPANG